MLPPLRGTDCQKSLQALSPLWIPLIPSMSTGITRAIFHSYLSVTHCPLIHQQASKRKHLPWVFILCLWRLASHISLNCSVCKRWKSVNIRLKLSQNKTNDVHKKRNFSRTQFVREIRSKHPEQSSFWPVIANVIKPSCGLMDVWQSWVRQLCT